MHAQLALCMCSWLATAPAVANDQCHAALRRSELAAPFGHCCPDVTCAAPPCFAEPDQGQGAILQVTHEVPAGLTQLQPGVCRCVAGMLSKSREQSAGQASKVLSIAVALQKHRNPKTLKTLNPQTLKNPKNPANYMVIVGYLSPPSKSWASFSTHIKVI